MNTPFSKDAFYVFLAEKFMVTARLMRTISICCFVAGGIGMAVAVFMPSDTPLFTKITTAFLGALTSTAGMMFLWRARVLGNPAYNPLLEDVFASGERIVWYYSTTSVVEGTKNYGVSFMNRYGKMRKIPAADADELVQITDGLRQLYPKAQTGFDAEIQKKMRRRYGNKR